MAAPTTNVVQLSAAQAKEQRRAFRAVFDFSGGPGSQALITPLQNIPMSIVASMFVDNSTNTSPLSINFPGSQETVYCPPLSQGFFPVLSLGMALQCTVTTAGTAVSSILFLNYEEPLSVWAVNGNGSTGTVNVTGAVTTNPALGTFTNKSGTVATGGTSQTLSPASGVRKRILIQNPATAAGQGIAAPESLYINFTSAAGVDNGTSLEIMPGGSYDSGGSSCTTELISVNAATSGHRYIAKELA